MLRKTRHLLPLCEHGMRSKYICIPNQVNHGGDHIIADFQKGREINVSPSIGFSHHYRNNCPVKKTKKNIKNLPNKVDRTIYKYKDGLLKNVKMILDKISDQCDLSDLPTKFQ